MARALAGLLSPEPGSVILGVHTGAQEKGVVNQVYRNIEVDMFAHSSESWIAMWDGEIFEKGMVKVETEFREVISDLSAGQRRRNKSKALAVSLEGGCTSESPIYKENAAH
ncbi:hypothetical protein AZE42_04056 [Rhizopogon vesiculosus]|uniref:Uncharacterized protein n=1 Tax=Rhizopogon vesiculosus TaxID=180088 RepID=A0A1J8QET1_9AGAM|nr:hypothetical protein AZE42_04056 [Rhizopogon vesiculosus]